MLHQGAVAGLGITILPRMMIKADLDANKLIPVLPEWQPDNRIIHALYPSRRGLLSAVRHFLDYLEAAIGDI